MCVSTLCAARGNNEVLGYFTSRFTHNEVYKIYLCVHSADCNNQ